MKAKLTASPELELETAETLVHEHTLKQRDLSVVEQFIRNNKHTGTLRVDFVNGGKTRVRFHQEFPVEVV